ncbi:hypothetical protein BM613_08500 [Sulfoacidibacillus thermotolerans]|uniref:Integrase catalytic domain-containing protein n=1 Tax=Sulfoacidibacillus thermotolerans TaxID=1765684 RepID=A0A2U3D8A0_SULT2|nr:hypothetical protein BM613_08500 [Sulfoacidibacillus thermotolerans]
MFLRQRHYSHWTASIKEEKPNGQVSVSVYLELEKFKTREQAIQRIFEYIEVWHNRERVHSSIGYLTPVEYERRYSQVSRAKAS